MSKVVEKSKRLVRKLVRRVNDQRAASRTPASIERIVSVKPGPRRREFIERHIPVRERAILEIGAFDQPTYKRDDAQISYFDHFSPEELVEKYNHIKTRSVHSSVTPDFVSKSKHFSADITARFDLVVANHVLEHVADPLTWFDQLANVTRPGGHLFMALPDRRYTFDILRRESTLSDWLRWQALDLQKPSADQLFDCIYYYRAIRHMDVWENRTAAKLEQKRFSADEAWERAKEHAKEGYPDTHCSVFSSQSFHALWKETEELDVPWRLVVSEDVVPGSNEFLILLRRM